MQVIVAAMRFVKPGEKIEGKGGPFGIMRNLAQGRDSRQTPLVIKRLRSLARPRDVCGCHETVEIVVHGRLLASFCLGYQLQCARLIRPKPGAERPQGLPRHLILSRLRYQCVDTGQHRVKRSGKGWDGCDEDVLREEEVARMKHLERGLMDETHEIDLPRIVQVDAGRNRSVELCSIQPPESFTNEVCERSGLRLLEDCLGDRDFRHGVLKLCSRR
ncbi:MAG: hypothetical protein Q8R02_08775 [Hyphomonadaceae bacterium]|nr:hypothetical protein [Hyphomonadaceae bacterium]